MDDNDETQIKSDVDDDNHTRKLTEAIDEPIHDDVCDILREVETSRENIIDGDDFRHVDDEMKIFEKLRNEASTTDGDVAAQQDRSQSPAVELEAVLVRDEIENIQTAEVQPAHVVQAEPMEDVLVKQQSENNKNIMEGERKKSSKITVAFAVVFLVIVVVIIVVVLSLDNDDSPPQAPSKKVFPDGNETIFDFPNITQHVLFGDIKTDCSGLKGNEQSFLNIKIRCGNINPRDGIEKIQLEDTSKGLNCSVFRPNMLDCNATLSGNSSAYGVIFTCGYQVNVKDLLVNGTLVYPYATVETSSIAGFGCQSFAKHSLTIARFCNNSVDKSSARSWNLQSGINYGSCSNSNEKRVGSWTLCEVEDTCTVTPCNILQMDEIFAIDILDEPTCENLGGTEQPYSPINTTSFFENIGSLIRLFIFNNTFN